MYMRNRPISTLNYTVIHYYKIPFQIVSSQFNKYCFFPKIGWRIYSPSYTVLLKAKETSALKGGWYHYTQV